MREKTPHPAPQAEKGMPPRILTASLYALFFAYALSVTMIGPLIPVIMDAYRIDLAQSGLITTLLGVGGALSVVAGAYLADLVKKSLLIKLSAFVYGLTLVMMAFMQFYVLFLVIYFFMGASTKLLDAVVNAYVSDIHTVRRGFYMNMLHAFFAMGAVAGPLVTSALLTAGADWHTVYLALGLFCLAVSVFYFAVQTRVPNETKPAGVRETRDLARLLKSGRLIALSAMGFLYTGVSAVFSTWMPSFMQKELLTGTFFASLPGAVYWLGILAGRLTYSFLSGRFGTKRLLTVNGVFACACLSLAAIVNAPVFYLIALLAAGFAMSAIMPFSVALGCSWYPENTGTVSSMIYFYATVGYMVLPFLYGAIAASTSLYTAIALTTAAPLLIALSASRLPSLKNRNKPE